VTSPTQRDRHLLAIESDGRCAWKRTSGYYAQSHAENAFSRMNYPAASCGVSTPKPKTLEQLQLDVLAMQLLIGLFLPLLLDILANGFLIAVPTNSADKVSFGPKFTAP
jgi:hypothetical protein